MSDNINQHVDITGDQNIVLGQGELRIDQRTTYLFSSPNDARALRHRDAMLKLVKSIWVAGVLENSLHGAVLIELGLAERHEAVEHPWDMVLQTPNQENKLLPPGTRIIDLFDQLNHALLILGEPGSGKTTILLELARDTIARAEKDPTTLGTISVSSTTPSTASSSKKSAAAIASSTAYCSNTSPS